jgi:hypothetical protein
METDMPDALSAFSVDEIKNRIFTVEELEAMSREQIDALCVARNIDASDKANEYECVPLTIFIDEECLEYSPPIRESDESDEEYAAACRECELAHELALRQREARIAASTKHD